MKTLKVWTLIYCTVIDSRNVSAILLSKQDAALENKLFLFLFLLIIRSLLVCACMTGAGGYWVRHHSCNNSLQLFGLMLSKNLLDIGTTARRNEICEEK